MKNHKILIAASFVLVGLSAYFIVRRNNTRKAAQKAVATAVTSAAVSA